MTSDITRGVEKIAEELGIDRKRSIGEVAQELKIEPHVIRFWEENFPQIKPQIGAGKRRYYYNKQLKILRRIKKFLYEEGYTIAGLKKLLNRRKKDDSKEEDLEFLVQATEISSSQEIEIDDFINSEVKVEIGSKIDPAAKLMDFSNIKVSLFDPRIKKEISHFLQSARQNLKRLKTISDNL